MDNTQDRLFSTAPLFGDHMVLQRNKPIRIWGEGPEGVRVIARLGDSAESVSIKDNRWLITLPPMAEETGLTLHLSCGDQVRAYSDICLGEVWLAGGQSNMEFFLRYDADREEVFQEPPRHNIRFFDMPRISYAGQLEEADYSLYGFWRIWDRDNLEYFSAVPFYFARKVQRDLNVPVGIIGCNWGGSPACTWMSRAYLENRAGRLWIEDYERDLATLDLDRYERDFKAEKGNFKNDMFGDETGERLSFGMTGEEMEEFMGSPSYSAEPVPVGPLDFRRPGGLYETMLSRAIPFSLRGFLWYQGESDEKHPQVYDTMMANLIRCWRDAWQEELPFLFVQLAPFRKWLHCLGEKYPLLREKQEILSRSVPLVWMASIMDRGMEWDIHPKEKKPVGERLALLALGKVYGQNILCESPRLISGERRDDTLILHFENAPLGLILKGDVIKSLEIDPCDRNSLRFSLRGDSLILESRSFSLSGEINIGFARTDYCEVNLFNSVGLPVLPFSLTL